MRRRLETLRAHLRRLFIEDWRVPFAAVSVIASLALFAAPYFFVTIQNERAAALDRLCRAVSPTKGIYRIVLDSPPSPQARAHPERAAAFRRELERGIAAVDALHCNQ